MEKIKVKFKKLNKRASIPFYAKKGDAGMDLVATTLIRTGKYFEYGTDLAIEMPMGYAGFLFPRSSISNTDHFLRNSVGVIDSGYRGELKLRMSIPALGEKQYKIGDKVGQIVLVKLPSIEIEEVQEISGTDRSDGAFGSTGS